MIRKIVVNVPEEQLKRDLEKYRQRALKLGATDAKIITAATVVIDERVMAKCTYPKCDFYGTNANCPPHAMLPEQVRKIVNNFHYAILLKIEAPSEEIAGLEAKYREASNRWRRKLHEIVSRIEGEAYYDGYHLALGFAGGACKNVYCRDSECVVLTGQPCRAALKARSAMEAVGIDAFTMAAKVGWDIYPVGVSSPLSEVPYGTRMGLVLIY